MFFYMHIFSIYIILYAMPQVFNLQFLTYTHTRIYKSYSYINIIQQKLYLQQLFIPKKKNYFLVVLYWF